MLHFTIPFFMRRRDPKDVEIERLKRLVAAREDELSTAIDNLQTNHANAVNQIVERDRTISNLRIDIQVLQVNVQCLRRKLSRPKKLGGKRGEPSRPAP